MISNVFKLDKGRTSKQWYLMLALTSNFLTVFPYIVLCKLLFQKKQFCWILHVSVYFKFQRHDKMKNINNKQIFHIKYITVSWLVVN